ncbi:class I SAM-dependent methyltransferase [Pseudomonas syringae]
MSGEKESAMGEAVVGKFDENTFDEYADLYQQMFNLPYRQRVELPTLDKLVGEVAGLKIMDFGCGPGFLSRWLRNKGAGKVVGYDVSNGMLEYAREIESEHPVGIEYKTVLGERDVSQYDVVLAVYVLPYCSNRDELFEVCRNVCQVLKPGGRLIALLMNSKFDVSPEYYRKYGFRLLIKEPLRDGSAVDLHICQPPYNKTIPAHFWSDEAVEEALRNVGFYRIFWKSHKPDLLTVQESELLADYLSCPHASIIEAFKK